MATKFAKFVEWATDSRYIPLGSRCSLCDERLGFFRTGFWSINAKWLKDGVICDRCHEKLELLAKYKNRWIPKERKKEAPFSYLANKALGSLDVQGAKTVLEASEAFGTQLCSAGISLLLFGAG